MKINKDARRESPYWVMPTGPTHYGVANRYDEVLISGITRELALDIVRLANLKGKLPDILGN